MSARERDAPTLGNLQARAIQASWWTAIQSTAAAPLAFIANLVVARSLGPHGFGLVASYMAAYSIVLAVLNGGVSDATIQWGAASYARHDREQLVAVARRCSGYHLLVEGPLGALAAAWLLRHESLTVQAIGAVSVALTMALGTAVVMVTAVSRTSVLAKQALVLGVALHAAVMVAAIRSHDPGWVWVVRLAVSTGATLLPLMSLPGDVRRAVLTPLLPTGWPKGFVSYSVRTLVAGLVASLVFSRCEVLVLDAYGLVGQAGLFALAAGIAGQITAPIDAMLGPLVPAAASLVATDEARAAFAIQRGVRLSALVTVPVLALVVPTLALLTPVIYGGRFHGVGLMFVALGLVSCVQSALHPATAFLGAVRRPLTVLGFNAMALVVDLTVVVLLAPMIGASAAVIATSAGQLTSLMLGIELLRRRLAMPVRPIIAAMRPLVLVSLVAAGSVALVLELPVGAIPGSAMALALAATGTWLVVRLSGGIVPQSDLDAVAAALPSRLQVATTVARRLGLVR